MPYATFSEAVDAIIDAINALQGPDNRTLTDIWNKLDTGSDNTAIETKLDELKAYWEILLKVGAEPGYYNLFEIAGVPLTDSAEFITYPPTLGGILAKLQNIQGPPLTAREGWTNERTKLKTLYDALSAPPPAGAEDPVNWWQEVKDMIDLLGTGVNIATDLYGFLSKTADTAANAATTGTTGATAIGQWVTAMALAIIAAQMNQAQNERIQIRINTGVLPAIETNTVHLADIETHLSAIGAHMDDLLDDQSISGKTNLYDLLKQLECICANTRKRLSVQDIPLDDEMGDTVITDLIEPPTADADKWCQRVQWLVDRIAFILGILHRKQAITGGDVRQLIIDELGIYPDKSAQTKIAYQAEQTKADNANAGTDGLIPLIDWIDANKADLVDAIYNAPGAQTARFRFDDATQAIELTNNEELLLRSFVDNRLMAALFQEEIPLEPYELTFYDAGFCGTPPTPAPGGIPPSSGINGGTKYTFLRENNDDEVVIVREGYFSGFPTSWPEREEWGLMESYSFDSSDGSNTFRPIETTEDVAEEIWRKDIFLYNIDGFEIFLLPLPGETSIRGNVFIIEDIGGPGETLHLIPSSAVLDPQNPNVGWFCNVTTSRFVVWSEEDYGIVIFAPPGKVS